MFSFLSKHALCFPVIDDVGDGIVAIGGDLSLDRLVLAYNSGIFPWYNSTDPIIWWSPDPRMVLFPEKFRASKSLLLHKRSGRFEVTRNKAFNEVIDNCASVKRTGQKVTWNFNKYLIDENGQLLEAFGSRTKPMSSDILDYLN